MSLNFTDLHDKMVQRKTKLITKKDFEAWLKENVEVKPYLSIATKYAVISIFSDNMNKQIKDFYESEYQNFEYIYLTYDINLIFDLLFKYLDMIVLSKYRTAENYDLVMQSGFYDYMMGKCGVDYKNMVEKCDRATGIDNLSVIHELTTIFANPPSVEEIEKIRDIINNDINPEKLEILQAMAEYNNPTMKKIIDKASEESVRENLVVVETNKE